MSRFSPFALPLDLRTETHPHRTRTPRHCPYNVTCMEPAQADVTVEVATGITSTTPETTGEKVELGTAVTDKEIELTIANAHEEKKESYPETTETGVTETPTETQRQPEEEQRENGENATKTTTPTAPTPKSVRFSDDEGVTLAHSHVWAPTLFLPSRARDTAYPLIRNESDL